MWIRLQWQGSRPCYSTFTRKYTRSYDYKGSRRRRKSEKDPELSSVRHYIQSGDWWQCKMPHYLSVKNELCLLGKIVMRRTRIVIPQSLKSEELLLAHEGHQGIVKTKSRLRIKVWWPKRDHDAAPRLLSAYVFVDQLLSIIMIFYSLIPYLLFLRRRTYLWWLITTAVSLRKTSFLLKY